MSMGGKAQTVGYKYYMGVQLALCHGPVDAVTELIVGERSAWTGNVTANASVQIDQPELFGGVAREGGLAGQIDICMGEASQPQNPYLLSVIGAAGGAVPAYRGLVTTVFRSFYWSAMNPYFKAPWWRVSRWTKGWSRGIVWYPEKIKIGALDMNPAHIAYEAMTNLSWGMGYSPDDFNDAGWRASADKLYSEGFGLSLVWTDQTDIETFLQMIMDHINGSIRMNLSTGKFELKLVRDDYTVADLKTQGFALDPSNVLSLDSYQRIAWGDTANEIVVTYLDRDQNEATVAVQDLASIEAQGGVVSTTRNYPGIREFDLASRVATRDLNTTSSPLAKVVLKCNRIAWDWDVSDVFVLTWPRLGINGVPFRITKINKGGLVDGTIEIEALEDVFGLPNNAYTAQQPSGWVEPLTPPAPVLAGRTIEAPYWDIVRNMSPADIAYLPAQYGFGEMLAVRPSADAYGFDLWASYSNGGTYSKVSANEFVPSALLAVDMALTAGPVTFTLASMVDVDLVDVGTYFYIDNEAFGITALNPSTGSLTAIRAVLDTVPAAHAAGARIWFMDQADVADPTVRTSGEQVYYKPLTRTGKGTLSLSTAVAYSLTLNNRAARPYPPGNIRVGGVYFPAKSYGAIAATWSHRDRSQETVDLIAFTAGNIGPETGTTYTVQVFDGESLKRTYTGITGTEWAYGDTDVVADGVLQNLRLVIRSARSGLTSWQQHDIAVDRHGFGFHFGEEFGGVAS